MERPQKGTELGKNFISFAKPSTYNHIMLLAATMESYVSLDMKLSLNIEELQNT